MLPAVETANSKVVGRAAADDERVCLAHSRSPVGLCLQKYKISLQWFGYRSRRTMGQNSILDGQSYYYFSQSNYKELN